MAAAVEEEVLLADLEISRQLGGFSFPSLATAGNREARVELAAAEAAEARRAVGVLAAASAQASGSAAADLPTARTASNAMRADVRGRRARDSQPQLAKVVPRPRQRKPRGRMFGPEAKEKAWLAGGAAGTVAALWALTASVLSCAILAMQGPALQLGARVQWEARAKAGVLWLAKQRRRRQGPGAGPHGGQQWCAGWSAGRRSQGGGRCSGDIGAHERSLDETTFPDRRGRIHAGATATRVAAGRRAGRKNGRGEAFAEPGAPINVQAQMER